MTTYTRRPLNRRATTSRPSSYWAGSRSAQSVPERAILTEDGEPIMTEYGDILVTET